MGRKFLLIITIIAIILTIAGCEFEVSTAKITKAVPCINVDAFKKPISPKDTFSTSDKAIHISIKTAFVPSETTIHTYWYYEGEEISSYSIDIDSSVYVDTHIFSDEGFPEGNYEAKFFVNDREKPDKIVKFKVE